MIILANISPLVMLSILFPLIHLHLLLGMVFSLPTPFESKVLNYSTEITVEKGTKTEARTYTILIASKEAEYLTTIQLPYQEDDHIEVTEALILDLSGNELRKISKKEIVTRSSFSGSTFYQDRYQKEFRMNWHTYPYIIKYSYITKTSRFHSIAYWIPYLKGIQIESAQLNIILPIDYPVNIKSDEKLVHHKRQVDENIHYEWRVNDLSTFEWEPYAPSFYEIYPAVKVVPINFEYGKPGSQASWDEFGTWILKLNEGLDELTPEEKGKVDVITRGIESKTEKIRRLYHYMQMNTRYINISIDEGGYIPYPASYVCRNKFGDCKALTIYMKALLKYAGISSFYTLIDAGNYHTPIDHNLPGAQFNHVILAVPMENDTVWLENTSKYNAFNFLGTFTQNRWALLVSDQGSQLVKTPVVVQPDVQESTTYKFNLMPNGDGTAQITKYLSKNEYPGYANINTLNVRDQEKLVNEEIYLSNFELRSYEFHPSDPSDLVIELDVKNQIRMLGEKGIISPSIHPIKNIEPYENRKYPIQINQPICWTDTIYYLFNHHEKISISTPDDVKIESKFGRYTIKNVSVENQIKTTRSLLLYPNKYPAEEYKNFHQFFNDIESLKAKNVFVISSFK